MTVHQRYRHALRYHRLFDQAFNPPTVSKDLRPKPERQHGTIRCDPDPRLEYHRVLLRGDHLRNRHVQPTREDLESLDNHGSLL